MYNYINYHQHWLGSWCSTSQYQSYTGRYTYHTLEPWYTKYCLVCSYLTRLLCYHHCSLRQATGAQSLLLVAQILCFSLPHVKLQGVKCFGLYCHRSNRYKCVYCSLHTTANTMQYMNVVGNRNSRIVNAKVPTNSWSGEYWHESTRPRRGLCFRPRNNRHRATNPDTCKLYNLKLLE